MSSAHDVIVIGGGLAGCATALQLARAGRRVLLLEEKRYPVHKLCGEFLSPEVQTLFRGLGVTQAIQAAGAVPMRRVLLTGERGPAWRGALPGEALGLSRYALDHLLFQAAQEAGAEGLQGARVSAVAGGVGAFRVSYRLSPTDERSATAPLVVGAYGKRARLDDVLERPFTAQDHGYVAFKLHYRGAALDDWIELHGFRGGYCGLSPVEGGLINACLLVRTAALRAAGRSFAGLRSTLMIRNPALRERLAQMTPVDERPLSIGQIAFCAKELFSGDVMMVGDTAALIAPLCGDGMAMALRGAVLAAPLLDAHLRGDLPFPALRRLYGAAWRRRFALRLSVGRILQGLLLRPRCYQAGLVALHRAPVLGPLLIRATREAA